MTTQTTTQSDPHKLALMWANLIHYSQFGHQAHQDPPAHWIGYQDPTDEGLFHIVHNAQETVPF